MVVGIGSLYMQKDKEFIQFFIFSMSKPMNENYETGKP